MWKMELQHVECERLGVQGNRDELTMLCNQGKCWILVDTILPPCLDQLTQQVQEYMERSSPMVLGSIS